MTKYENVQSLIEDLQAYREDAMQGRGMTKEEVITFVNNAVDFLATIEENITHNVGIALKSKILGGEYQDYMEVELTDDEEKELDKRVMDVGEIETVEGIINVYLREIGFEYNEKVMLFLRK